MQRPGYTKAAALTPNDSTAISPGFTTKGIYIGGAGNLSVIINAATVAFQGVLAGTILPIAPTHVRATGTTATNLVAVGD
jgi:hypothetical protein